MKVLVACEESQVVMSAFRKLGHDAFSCDLQECSGAFPQYHIKGDCIPVIENNSWDLIVAHPPCTYLCVAGSCNLLNSDSTIKDYKRYENMLAAREFFMYFYNLDCKICIENPKPMKIANLPGYSQIVQPFQYGDNYSKLTCLWLKKLPYLIPSCVALDKRGIKNTDIVSYTSIFHGSKNRSKFFPGISQAMALQWG